MFHDYWMNNQLNLPVYVVKYEDLLENPQKILSDIFEFLLDIDDIRENMKVSELIKSAVTS